MLIADPSTELDDTGVINVDPVVVVADRPEWSPDAKVVSRHELRCSTLVRHAVRVEVNDLTAQMIARRDWAIATDAKQLPLGTPAVGQAPNYDDDR